MNIGRRACGAVNFRIYVGLRDVMTGESYSLSCVHDICQKYVDSIGWCVTVTPTKFLYKNGREDGAIIGIINYPRFPSTTVDIKERVEILAVKLLRDLHQLRLTIVDDSVSLMLENEDLIKECTEKFGRADSDIHQNGTYISNR
jgi:hypothetical protein